MGRFGTRRRCPYCGETIELGDCPIVATNFEGAQYLASGGPIAGSVSLPSEARVLRRLDRTGWPVLAEAPREARAQTSRRPSQLERLLGAEPGRIRRSPRTALTPLFEVAAREDLPARACPECEFALPQAIDERPAVVIGVVGVNAVGKTNLMAAGLGQAYRQDALARIGVTEFVPDESTSSRFLDEYYKPLFQEGRPLEGTQVNERARFAPLVFNVTLRASSFSLILHDVAGESLADLQTRSAQAQFLHGARGIIFVVDPRDIDTLRDEFPAWMLEDDALGWDQGALLSACLRSDGILGGGSPIPVALTVAKADLFPALTGEDLPFLEPAPKDEREAAFTERVKRASQQVAGFLERHEAHTILGPAREYERRLAESASGPRMALTYHAVSALGSAPDRSAQLSTKVRPINCVDPLAAVLSQVGSA